MSISIRGKTILGPNVVTDGLSLNLDVNNTKSYPGSGSVWYDLVNNLQFNSSGTQTPLETKANSQSFAFNDSGYWYCNTNYSLVDLGGDCTLIMWLYGEDIINRKTVFEKAGTIYASYEQELAITWEVGGNFSYYSRHLTYDYGFMEATTTNSWNMMSLKMSSGKSSTVRTGFRSKNGSAWMADYYTRSGTALVAAADIKIGTGYAGTCDVGNIGMILAYNRMLSDDEILQNYNALKNRYNL
jgi:hypothetical protein